MPIRGKMAAVAQQSCTAKIRCGSCRDDGCDDDDDDEEDDGYCPVKTQHNRVVQYPPTTLDRKYSRIAGVKRLALLFFICVMMSYPMIWPHNIMS